MLLGTSQSALGTEMASTEGAEYALSVTSVMNPLKPSGHCKYRQFYMQQFYVLPTQCVLSVLCGSQNKQRLFH